MPGVLGRSRRLSAGRLLFALLSFFLLLLVLLVLLFLLLSRSWLLALRSRPRLGRRSALRTVVRRRAFCPSGGWWLPVGPIGVGTIVIRSSVVRAISVRAISVPISGWIIGTIRACRGIVR